MSAVSYQTEDSSGTGVHDLEAPLVRSINSDHAKQRNDDESRYSSDSDNSEEDEEDDEQAQLSAEDMEVNSSFYELNDLRVPSSAFFPVLRRFYAFFLALGIPVARVRTPRKRKKECMNGSDDIKRMVNAGVSPVPLEYHGHQGTRSWWVMWLKVQWGYFALWLLAWTMYFGASLTSQVLTTHELEDDALYRVWLQIFFSCFQLLSLLASVQLARDLLSKRLLGTRIFYALHSTSQPRRARKLLIRLLYTTVPVCLGIAALGIASDLWSRPNGKFLLGGSTPMGLSHHREWVAPVVNVWALSAVLVRLQQVAGVGVLSALLGIQLIRINSCIRRLKRPGTTVYQASLHVFDIDASLAELGHTLDMPVSMLIVTNFLALLFETVFILNRNRDADAGNDAVGGDFLAIAFPGLICGWVFMGFSGINSACTQLRLVATRYAAFQDRERIRMLYCHRAEKQREKQSTEEADQSEEEEKAGGPSGEKANKSSDASKDKGTRERRKKERKKDRSFDTSMEGPASQAKEGSKSSKDTMNDSTWGPEENATPAAGGSSPKSKRSHNSKYVSRDLTSSSRSNGIPASEALERSQLDQDGDGDIDLEDDLELLRLRLKSLMQFLDKACDLSLRLATIQLDAKVMWGFCIIMASTVLTLLDIKKPDFL